jgi:Tol biopolymer transport system component
VYQVGLPGTGIDLVFQSLQGIEQRVVHPKLQQFSRPRFDPRGQAVVVHGTSPEGTQGIFRIDAASGDVTLLASNPRADLANPAWSRDGRTLFFEADDRSVWTLRRDSNETTEVYAFPTSAPNFTAAPSPDGRQLASVHGASLYIIDVDTRVAKEILRLNAPERLHDFPGSLAWMPDGHSIIFGKRLGEKRELWRISKEGTGLQPVGLHVEQQNLYFLRIGQDGRRLAFVVGDYDVRPVEVWAMENFLR